MTASVSESSQAIGLILHLGFPGGSVGKESTCNAGDLGSILGWEDPLEKGRLSTPVLWPREFNELYPWSSKEPDMTEPLSLSFTLSLEFYMRAVSGMIYFFPLKHWIKSFSLFLIPLLFFCHYYAIS